MIMNYSNLHPWKVNIQQAVRIQQKLRKKIILSDNLPKINRVAAVDVAFTDDLAICAVCIFEYPGLNLIQISQAKRKVTFAYVPGLLTFREGPVILQAFRRLKTKPDLVLFDGQGICHSRRMGIATHLGMVLNLPSIGCAKSHLYGVYQMPRENKGDFSYIYERNTNEVLGIALRTRRQVKPLFVSCGYKTSLTLAIRLILKLCPKYRIPQPLRFAHRLASDFCSSRRIARPIPAYQDFA